MITFCALLYRPVSSRTVTLFTFIYGSAALPVVTTDLVDLFFVTITPDTEVVVVGYISTVTKN